MPQPLLSPVHRKSPIEIHSELRGDLVGLRLGSKSVAAALTACKGNEPFHLASLPFKYDALEPFIDRETMEWHHQVYHRGEVDRLNLLLKNALAEGVSLESILACVSRFDPAVRSCGGAHWNHAFFWSVMTDCMEDHEMPSSLLHAIENSFHSFERFKAQFIEVGTRHQGPGWLWLVKTADAKLQIVTTLNDDNPLMDVVADRGRPILACDLWEHARHSRLKDQRGEFLRRFFAVIHWERVGTLFSECLH